MDDLQAEAKANRCDPDAPYLLPKCVQKFAPPPLEPTINADDQTQTIKTQDLAKGGSGSRYTIQNNNQLLAQPIIQISYPPQRPTNTNTTGHSEGRSHTTTHTRP